MLTRLLDSLSFSPTVSLEEQSLHTAFIVMTIILFLSMLHAGNVLPDCIADADPLRHLSWGNVSFTERG